MKLCKAIVIGLFAAVLVLNAGCGSDSQSTLSSSNEDVTRTAPSVEFLGPENGKTKGNEFASLGHEADAEEREAASTVLEENLKARAAHDWSKQCASLSARERRDAVERLELELGKTGRGKATCPFDLKIEAEGAGPHILDYTLTGPIDVLRVRGKEGYALYHGTDGKDYAMPMVKEDGEWKVDSLVTVPVAKG